MELFLLEGIFDFLEMFISCFLASRLFRGDESRKKTDTLVLLVSALAGMGILLLREYLLTFIPDFVPALAVFILYSVLICKAKWWAGITWALVNYLFIGIVVITSDYALRMLLPADTYLTPDSTYYWIIACIITRIGQLIFTELIVILWRRFPASSKTYGGSIKTIVVALTSLISVWLLWSGRFEICEDALYANSFACLLILGINCTFLFFDELIAGERRDKEQLETQNRLAELQIRSQEEVNNMYRNILSLKHDINNHLHTISGYLQVGEYAKAQSYVEEIAGEVSGLRSFHSGNTAIDAILGSKTAFADLNHIAVQADLTVPPEIGIDDGHLTVLLGNLYDNAIDANLKIEDMKSRFINIRISYDSRNVFFLFENAALKKGRSSYTDIWTTTKDDSLNHGYGLKNIDKVIRAYNGYCERELNDHVFRCRIRIPLGSIGHSRPN